jgi:2-keto-3-deoxy-L-rhamnonate aldolase RhmA
MEEYKRLANQNTMLIAFIESEEGVRNLQDILKSEIDAIHIARRPVRTITDPRNSRKRDYIVSTARKAGHTGSQRFRYGGGRRCAD